MMDTRYYVLLSTSGPDVDAERQMVAQTLAAMGFFCWSPERRSPLTTNLIRRQIDDADYFVVLMSGQYGTLSASGVSYLHLDYIYALSRQKPMLVLLHDNPELLPEGAREPNDAARGRFREFRRQLQRDRDLVLTFRDVSDLERVLQQAMPQLCSRYPVQGWNRPRESGIIPVRPAAPAPADSTQLLQLQRRIQQLEQELAQQQRPAPPPAVPRTQPVSPLTSTSLPALPADTRQAGLEDYFTLEYRVQAYQDGNFKELKPQRVVSWHDLLVALGPGFSLAASEDNFSRLMSDFLAATALIDARQQLPRAHAVSRCQVSVQTLYTIKAQMRQNGWIIPIGRDAQHRILWELSELGQQVVSRALMARA